MRVTNNSEEIGRCGCGRSPTGKCIGWHGLNPLQLEEAQILWHETQKKKSSSQLKLNSIDETARHKK
jgi:hypothetical protein